jgi:hypothetical protein
MRTKLSQRLVQFAALVQSTVAEYVPIITDGYATDLPKASFHPARRPRIYDRALSIALAEKGSLELFGESRILVLLDALIRAKAAGQQYSHAKYLSGLVEPYSFAMQKFIVGCPAGSADWRDLEYILRDGLIMYSTSGQAIWSMLPLFRKIAESWVRRDELAKATASLNEEEQESSEGSAPAPRPGSSPVDDDEHSLNSPNPSPR